LSLHKDIESIEAENVNKRMNKNYQDNWDFYIGILPTINF